MLYEPYFMQQTAQAQQRRGAGAVQVVAPPRDRLQQQVAQRQPRLLGVETSTSGL